MFILARLFVKIRLTCVGLAVCFCTIKIHDITSKCNEIIYLHAFLKLIDCPSVLDEFHQANDSFVFLDRFIYFFFPLFFLLDGFTIGTIGTIGTSSSSSSTGIPFGKFNLEVGRLCSVTARSYAQAASLAVPYDPS